jgi:hypothetical protein
VLSSEINVFMIWENYFLDTEDTKERPQEVLERLAR